MSTARLAGRDPRIDALIVELQERVTQRYPSATFEVFNGVDPEGTYLRATADVEDTDALLDLVIERLLDAQVEERLPLYFVASRPLERGLQQARSGVSGGHDQGGSQ